MSSSNSRDLKSPIERAKRQKDENGLVYYSFWWRFQNELTVRLAYYPRQEKHPNGYVHQVKSQIVRFYFGKNRKSFSPLYEIGPYLLSKIHTACAEKWQGNAGYIQSSPKPLISRENYKRKVEVKPPKNEGSEERLRALSLLVAADALTWPVRKGSPSKLISELNYPGYTETELLRACKNLGYSNLELFWFIDNYLGWDGKEATRVEIESWIADRRMKWAA